MLFSQVKRCMTKFNTIIMTCPKLVKWHQQTLTFVKVRKMTKVTCPKLGKVKSNLLESYIKTSFQDWQKLFQALTDMCHLI